MLKWTCIHKVDQERHWTSLIKLIESRIGLSLIKSIESRLSEIRDNCEEPVLIKQRVTRQKGNSQWQVV